jgi:flagella synthesis protein FlgN
MPAAPAAIGSANPAETLPQEQQAARLLIDVLNQEQALLIAADIDSLAMVTERKAPLVAQMSELAMRRHRTLGGMGLAASEAGMQAWINQTTDGKPAHPAASSTWSALLSMARQAQEINRINGLLINTHMARNQSALNVLKVQRGSGTGGSLYGPDGQASGRGMGRGLVVG